jgi:hypothetical protein
MRRAKEIVSRDEAYEKMILTGRSELLNWTRVEFFKIIFYEHFHA